MHPKLEDNSTSTVRGKQINLHQNYPVDCFGEHFHFHFPVNYSSHCRFWQQSNAQYISHLLCQTKDIFVIRFGREGLVHDISTSMPNPRGRQHSGFSAAGARKLLMEAVWFWVAQLAQIGFNTQNQLYCVFLRLCLRQWKHKSILHTESAAFFVLVLHGISVEGCTSVTSPSDCDQLFKALHLWAGFITGSRSVESLSKFNSAYFIPQVVRLFCQHLCSLTHRCGYFSSYCIDYQNSTHTSSSMPQLPVNKCATWHYVAAIKTNTS